MEQLPKIEARIESLGELDDLVGALRSMSASHARAAQAAFQATRSYCRIIERAIGSLAAMANGAAVSGGAENDRVLIAVGSEHGFVGGFNQQLIDRVRSEMEEGEALIVVGRRGEARAREVGLAVERSFPMTSNVAGITPLARRISARLTEASSARIAFARYRHGAAYDVTIKRVLPLKRSLTGSAAKDAAPLHHLPLARLMQGLASEYLFAEVADALVESLASENAARLRTMEAASRNIEDKLDKLRRDERAVRQEEITSDLLDVVTGVAAVIED
ncbi:F0F1 ATP synthase subunit gamma [Ostreiculturibacter nitratireducens]|uniref:F0F1 ATP synthase subunit gamma n=1 Tax=Ostreiculturibacter nitratireducens TaxID=3075226 RepID=UPI0031B63A3D